MSAIEKYEPRHIHEYERSPYNKDVYRCVHPRCSHYQRRGYLIGKEAICAECKNPFILDRLQLKNKRPRCEFCQKSPKAAQARAARDLAIDSFKNLPDEIKKSILDETLE